MQQQKPQQYQLFNNQDQIIQSLSDQDQNIKGKSHESNPQVKWKNRIKNSDSMLEINEEEDQIIDIKPSIQKIVDEQKYKSFISSKIKISQIVERKSQIKEANEQLQFQFVPCPYCAKQLTLSELDHTQNCRFSFQCRYCKQTYPKALLSDHLIVCNKIRGNQNKSKKFMLGISNEIAAQNKYINIVKSRPKTFQQARERIRQDIGELGGYNPYQLDMQSRIRADTNRGFDKRQIKAFKTTIYSRKKDIRENSQCSVCMNQLQSGDIIMKLNCSHYFHQDCLRPWLKMKTQCPTCKANIEG